MQMINLALSLALVFMMVAGLVSGLQELLAAIAQWRGKMLLRGVQSLLHEGEVNLLAAQKSGAQAPDASLSAPLSALVFGHPMVQALRDGQRLPSYLPAGNFAMALADLLVRESGQTLSAERSPFEQLARCVAEGQFKNSKLVNPELHQLLELLVAQAGGKAEALQAGLEQHFDQVMQRVSGWYKRLSQFAGFWLALGVAICLNINALAIAEHLNHHPQQAAELADQAAALVAALPASGAQPAGTAQNSGAPALPDAPGSNAPTKTTADASASLAQLGKQALKLQDSIAQLQASTLPLGWHWPADFASLAAELAKLGPLSLLANLLISLPGWLLTALAATLGAPFWFDLMSQLVALRGGTKPAKAATPP